MSYSVYYFQTTPYLSGTITLLLLTIFLIILLDLAKISIAFTQGFEKYQAKKTIVKRFTKKKSKALNLAIAIIIGALVFTNYFLSETEAGLKAGSIMLAIALSIGLLFFIAGLVHLYIQSKIKHKKTMYTYFVILLCLCAIMSYVTYALSFVSHPELMEKWQQLQQVQLSQ